MTTTFPAIPYLEWIVGRASAATYDLATSDLRYDRADEHVVPPRLAALSDPDEPSLTSQLASRYDVHESHVLVTAGATHANFLAACALLDRETPPTEDDEPSPKPQVLIEKPGYQPLAATPEALGARVDRFLRPEETDYRLDPQRIGNAATDDFAYAVVTNRHNPTGRLESRETLSETAGVVADAGGHLLVDEVYAPYLSDPMNGPFGGPTAAGLPNAVVSGSLTKLYGLGHLRIGWLVGPESVIERARTASMHMPSVAGPSSLLARRALHHGDELEAVARGRVAENTRLLTDFIESRPALEGFLPEDCPFAFLQHESMDGTEISDAAWDESILVVPGRFFDYPEKFRLSLGGDPDAMAEALDVFGSVLDSST
ncbi:pyridoxal phosphate-dependent aminotransferase [Haloferax sp. DFSO60]|uniref:pyridoxal phosphate-dependent aminotransferase n=1 Tax=Haloferax sp. DFSO60 TaxID=3388652 RepID=UPI0039780F29